MSGKSAGKASITINRPPAIVWAAVADITRMGEWSPECTGGKWVGAVHSPGVGARFEGQNEAKVAGRTVKKWTTTSEVTACETAKLFEFVAENFTTWRYTFEPAGEGTLVTETFAYEPKGFQGFLYETLFRRNAAMTKGMQRTLARVKSVLEAA